MIEYQIRAVCHLSKKQLSRAWQKVSGANDWAAKESSIVTLSDRCLANIAPLQREEMVQHLASQNEKLANIVQTEEKILNTMKDYRQKDKEAELLRTLKSAAGNYKGGMEFNPDSVKGTCEWFFADPSFCGWRDAPDAGLFWLTAGPGCGKSVLARALLKAGHLQTTATTVNVGSSEITSSVATVCYFFFKDDDVQRTKITVALAALLHQLFSEDGTKDLIEHVLPEFQGVGDSLVHSFEDLWGMLLLCAEKSSGGDIICILDALDECNSRDREQLVRRLDSFYDGDRSAMKTNLKFLITSRPYYDIEKSFRPLAKGTQYFRFDADERHEEISHDIGLVIDAEMEQFASDFDDADRQKIATTLKEKGTKTYLWLHLTLRIMKTDPSQYSRRRDVDTLLADIPAEVSEAYEKILSKATNEKITSTLLQILLGAVRPLTVEEANYMLTLALDEDGFETHAQLEAERWKAGFKYIVKSFSGLLISVYDGTLSFIHLTAQEYLTHGTEAASPATRWGGRFADAAALDELMSRCCMQYLFVSEIATRVKPLLSSSQYPLFYYAADHWPHHFESQPDTSKQRWAQQARRLCNTEELLLTVWGPWYGRPFDGVEITTSFFGWTTLSVVAYLGLTTLVAELLEDKATDVNEESARYGSALNASIVAHQYAIAESLIAAGADVNAIFKNEGTPLMRALNGEDEKSIALLLAKGALPLLEFPLRHRDRSTVLLEATMRGSKRTFEMLMSAAVDISTPDKILAASKQERIIRCGMECVTRLLGLLPDEELYNEIVLNKDILKTLLNLHSTQERTLHVLVKYGIQDILLDEPYLSLALLRTKGDQVVRSALEQRDAPCPSITTWLLEDYVESGHPYTLKALLRYCPEGACDVKRLLMRADFNIHNSKGMFQAVMDTAPEALSRDQGLQDELLVESNSLGVIYAFLRLPAFTMQVARRLIQITLRRSTSLYPLGPGEERGLIQQILDHCTEKVGVINDILLLDGAAYAERETVQWLLELSDEDSVSRADLLEAAASNLAHGKSIMAMLLQDDYSATYISPQVVQAAMDEDDTILDWLLEEYGERVTMTVEILLSARHEEAFDTLMKWRADEVASFAPLALKKATEDRYHHSQVLDHLIPHCVNLLVGATEGLILALLDNVTWGVASRFELLVATAGDDLVLTERILAMIAAEPRLLEMVRNWRPHDFRVTPSLIAMIAAGGQRESLDYLVRCCDATIDTEWYRLADFRSMLVRTRDQGDVRKLEELWAEGFAADVVDTVDANGMTALHCAADRERVAPVPFLLDVMRVAVDAVDRCGWTALHHAVRNTHLGVVQLLVRAGADPHKPDLLGRTPMMLAQGCELCASVGSGLAEEDLDVVRAVLSGEVKIYVDLYARNRRASLDIVVEY